MANLFDNLSQSLVIPGHFPSSFITRNSTSLINPAFVFSLPHAHAVDAKILFSFHAAHGPARVSTRNPKSIYCSGVRVVVPSQTNGM